jgi:hypothetical protein
MTSSTDVVSGKSGRSQWRKVAQHGHR